MRAMDAHGVLVSHERVTGPLDVRFAEPDDSVALLIPICRTGQFRLNGCLADSRRVFLLTSGEGVRFLTSADVSCHVVRVPWDQVERIMEVLDPGRPLRRVETRSIELAGRGICGIQSAIDQVLSIEHQDPGNVESSIASLVESVAQLFLSQDGNRKKHLSDPRALRRALEFIDANLQSDFSIVGLCEVACLHRRSLERLFKKEFGISPVHYILGRRMNSVRRQLMVSDPCDTSVSTVAQDNGFAHLGRFAGKYREFFSELPSETLRSPASCSARG
jgi:AraC-like DNA-binding protein